MLGAGVEITSTQFYSGGYTDDLRRALLYLSNKYPRAKLLGVGFSLGANVMTRYLGEEGENSRLVSGCALACVRALALECGNRCSLMRHEQPWDLVANSKQSVYILLYSTVS